MKKRYIEYDIMRILACFCVIMIHCAVFNQGSLYDYRTSQFQAINIWGVMSRWAVPVFVMLSGMMILPKGDEVSIAKIMKKRVFRMIFVYIVWSAVYSFYNTYVLGIVYAPTKFKTFIDGCFSGEMHMWYIPMLAGMYLAAPILAILIKNIDQKWSMYWIVCLFIFTSIIPFLIKLDIKFVSTIIQSINGYTDLQFFGGYTLYFILGYYVQNREYTIKQKNCIYIMGIISFIFTMWGTVVYYIQNGQALGVLPYEYPNIIMYSVAILLFFKERISKIHFTENQSIIIYEVSKLTFGIYLIHVLLLKIWYSCGINIQLFHPLGSIPFVALIVFISGGMIIWIIRKVPLMGTYLA